MKKIFLFFIVLLVAVVSVSADTVLIAKEDTGYKKKLVEALVEKLEADNLDVMVIDHSKGELAGVNPEEFSVVYVLNSGAQARVRPQVLEWLDSVKGHDGNVIVHTTKRTVWDENLGVDALSSASKNSNIDEVTDDIVARIEAKL